MPLMVDLLFAALGFLFGMVLAPYLRSYSMKKGENLATHEDINKLVDQVKAVTEATKSIEAEISKGLWDKQKRWEMKRQVLFEAARRVSEIDDAILSFSILMKEDHAKRKAWEAQRPSHDEEFGWLEVKSERLPKWSKASTEFDESRAFVRITCSTEASQAFSELGTIVNNTAAALTKDPDGYDKAKLELFKKIAIAQIAIRKELEVDEPKVK